MTLLSPTDIHSLSKSKRSVNLIHIADVIVHSYVDLHHNIKFTCDIDKDEHEFSSTSEASTQSQHV